MTESGRRVAIGSDGEAAADPLLEGGGGTAGNGGRCLHSQIEVLDDRAHAAAGFDLERIDAAGTRSGGAAEVMVGVVPGDPGRQAAGEGDVGFRDAGSGKLHRSARQPFAEGAAGRGAGKGGREAAATRGDIHRVHYHRSGVIVFSIIFREGQPEPDLGDAGKVRGLPLRKTDRVNVAIKIQCQ